MPLFAILLFTFIHWFFVLMIGGFNLLSVTGWVCSFVVLIVFWISTEAVAFLRDKPLFDVYEYMIMVMRELGALLAMLFMYALISIFVGASIWILAQFLPEAFSGAETGHPSFQGEAARRGFSIVLFFGVLYLIGKFPVRISTMWKSYRSL